MCMNEYVKGEQKKKKGKRWKADEKAIRRYKNNLKEQSMELKKFLSSYTAMNFMFLFRLLD